MRRTFFRPERPTLTSRSLQYITRPFQKRFREVFGNARILIFYLSIKAWEEKSLPKSHLGWFFLVFGEGKATKENISIFWFIWPLNSFKVTVQSQNWIWVYLRFILSYCRRLKKALCKMFMPFYYYRNSRCLGRAVSVGSISAISRGPVFDPPRKETAGHVTRWPCLWRNWKIDNLGVSDITESESGLQFSYLFGSKLHQALLYPPKRLSKWFFRHISIHCEKDSSVHFCTLRHVLKSGCQSISTWGLQKWKNENSQKNSQSSTR